MSRRVDLARALDRARRRTLALTDFSDEELCRQYSPLMSPLVWDLAHIGTQEDLWAVRAGDFSRPGLLPPEVESLYDAFEHCRSSRIHLPLLSPAQARIYCRDVREAALGVLAAVPEEDEAALFRFGLVISHENQHDETMLQALNLRQGAPLMSPGTTPRPGRAGVAGTSVLIPGGPFMLGVDEVSEPLSLDNERPAHLVEVPAFRIGRVPVTNAEWRQFMADGGYQYPQWWSTRGWNHRMKAEITAPEFWNADGTRTRFGHIEEIPDDEPVQHVTFFEAEAFAAWAGARLPTEIEWEKACAWDSAAGQRRRYPWGSPAPTKELANLGGGALGPSPVGAYPAGASAYGAEQMLGDVWEWTSSSLRPWPGFTPMIYRQYTEPFFGGDYKVLRGGSWAVAPDILRPSFRNWDHPFRRQIFAGVRLAWSAEGER